MISADKRKCIYLLHEEGMSFSQIANRLRVSRPSVKSIVLQQGELINKTRKDKVLIDEELLRELYRKCNGRVQRMHEKLAEENNIKVTYSTLTRLLRELDISKTQSSRCDQKPDEPGVEMQHDTSEFKVLVGDQKLKLIASVMYMRYSKRRYLIFYRKFNRFNMKCFFHETLMFWGYSAGTCIIDNTNLARLRGTGKHAVIAPEMSSFSAQYGFRFICHEIHHSNRKAGEERSFYTITTNFLPGRTFTSLKDLNEQAFQWSTVRMENRPQTKSKIIPSKVFEHEMNYLIELPSHIPAPYQSYERLIDQYGYIPFEGNFYWIPGHKRHEVQVLRYSGELKVYYHHELLISYPLPDEMLKNQKVTPPGGPTPPHQPGNRKRPTAQEEKCLRDMDKCVNNYLDFALKGKGLKRHAFIRKLLALSNKISLQLFIDVITRAHKYKINEILILENIATLYFQQEIHSIVNVEVDEHLQERENYQEGYLSDKPDLSIYDKLMEGENE